MTALKETVGPRHYTVENLHHRWGAHCVTIRRWIREDRLKALRLGRLVRITAEEVARFEREGAGS
jgi:excisionase family DNA binding protein